MNKFNTYTRIATHSQPRSDLYPENRHKEGKSKLLWWLNIMYDLSRGYYYE